MPSSASSGLRPEEKIQQAAQRLVGRAEAVDVLITSLSRILENPREEKYRKVNISNPKFQQYVASAPGGMEFMYAVGFEPMHGYLVNQRQARLAAPTSSTASASASTPCPFSPTPILTSSSSTPTTAAARPSPPPSGPQDLALLWLGKSASWRKVPFALSEDSAPLASLDV